MQNVCYHLKINKRIFSASIEKWTLHSMEKNEKTFHVMDHFSIQGQIELYGLYILKKTTTKSFSILFFTQSFPSFLNTCTIHLSLLHLITSLTFSMHILSLNSAFVFFSLSDTPHIYLTILISALSSFASCSAFTAHVSLPYIIELQTHAHTLSLSTSMPPSCQNT